MDVLAVVKAVMDVTVGAGAAVVQGIPEVPMTGDVETGPDGGITAREALNYTVAGPGSGQ